VNNTLDPDESLIKQRLTICRSHTL